MSSLAEIDRLMQEADEQLAVLTKQTVWFKAQRDWWRLVLDRRFAWYKKRYTGPGVKAKEAAIDSLYEDEPPIDLRPYLPGPLALPQLVAVCDAAYDNVQREYDYVTTHLSVLQSRNKNIMLDYNTSGSRW